MFIRMAKEGAENPTRRVSLTRTQIRTAEGAELLKLCGVLTEDGTLSADGLKKLSAWLDDHRRSDLPAVHFLKRAVERASSMNVRIPPDVLIEIAKDIEKILPPESRQKFRVRRRARRAAARAKLEAEREADRQRKFEERERNKPVISAYFKVKGVIYEGRADVILQYARPKDTVYLIRDRAHRHDRNAIEVRLNNGTMAGYVPRDYAVELAPLLDAGCRHIAFIDKILGYHAPVPMIDVTFYGNMASVEGAIAEEEVPAKPNVRAGVSPLGRELASGSNMVLTALGVLIAMLLIFVIWKMDN